MKRNEILRDKDREEDVIIIFTVISKNRMLKQNSDPSHEHDFDVQDGETQKIHTQDNQDIIM